MSLRTSLLPVVDRIRGLAGPARLDIRPYSLLVRTRTWSTGVVQKGTPSISDLVIVPPPKVVESGRELNVGPITPEYVGGGYSPRDLNPADSPGVEFYYLVTGPEGVSRPYVVAELNTSRPFGYFVRLVSLDRKVPF